MKIEKGIRYPIRNGVVDYSKFEIRVTVNAKLRSKVIDRSLGIKVFIISFNLFEKSCSSEI